MFSSKTQWGRLISCLPQLDSVDLVAPELILGRSEECDIVIHKSKFLEKELVFVSKEHFIIQRDFEDEFIVYLHDLSKNGTYVNDALVGRHKRIIIQNNDSIAIGNKLKVYIYKSMNHPVEESFIPAELRKKYVTSRLLGVGGCGQVRLVYDKVTCQQYALKKITKSRDSPSQIHNINHPKRVETEITILEGLSHPGNILLSTTDTKTLLKITDFGLSFLLMGYEEVMKTVCGTLFYIAPEILNPTIKEYNSQVDIWSLGVILFYMLSKQLPFQSNDRASLARLIINGKYSMKEPIWYEISFQAKDLIAKMLKVNSKERINIHDILSHSWIEKDHLLRYTVENMLKKEVERNQQTSMTN
ncbi:ovarian-specific serine/threonine-protein kinase Lok isoform X3 [Leptinotarsa decemlineata]|uniref:ovarian-specific serine/threonine-protein kinase Lok isoform X3 n=1 Tax=Leptinotarsa decemlineata TaxID=7539 RepID=UPI003D30582B